MPARPSPPPTTWAPGTGPSASPAGRHWSEVLARDARTFLLDALEATGRATNTVILFTADHGLAVGHHGLLGKQNMYEQSLRPPLILAGPGIPKDQRIHTPVYLQDIMPTTLELAGAPIPDYVEFKSLLPLLRGERQQQYPAISSADLSAVVPAKVEVLA